MEKFRKLIVHRGVILLSGILAFVATCATLSPDSASTPQLWGFGIYFLSGLLLFRSMKDAVRVIIFFVPFSFAIFVALTDNPGLVPEVVPLLIITCLFGFYTGSLLVHFIHRKRSLATAALVAGGTLYISVVMVWIVPLIVYSKQLEPIAPVHLKTQPLKFVNHVEGPVVMNTKRISVIDFWFTKCGVCYPNNDYLNVVAAKYKPLGVDFYLVYMGDSDSFEEFQSFRQASRWGNLIHLYDPMSTIATRLGLEGAPHTLVISDDTVVYHQSGFSEETKALETRKLHDVIMGEVARNADSRSIFTGIKNSVDLGLIDIQHDSVFTYRLQNTFDKPISIQNVTGSCNCLISEWSGDPIQPDEYGSISFTVEPDTFSTDTKTILIATSSSASPYTVVDVLYTIRAK